MVKLTIEQLEDMTFEGGIDIGDVTYTVVEESEWEHGHKHQSKTVIFTDGNTLVREHLSLDAKRD
uniref:hypothetical protein n=1 Tax=Serratia quinivorans TaxID=137545 RepID=UPI0035C6FF90